MRSHEAGRNVQPFVDPRDWMCGPGGRQCAVPGPPTRGTAEVVPGVAAPSKSPTAQAPSLPGSRPRSSFARRKDTQQGFHNAGRRQPFSVEREQRYLRTIKGTVYLIRHQKIDCAERLDPPQIRRRLARPGFLEQDHILRRRGCIAGGFRGFGQRVEHRAVVRRVLEGVAERIDRFVRFSGLQKREPHRLTDGEIPYRQLRGQYT